MKEVREKRPSIVWLYTLKQINLIPGDHLLRLQCVRNPHCQKHCDNKARMSTRYLDQVDLMLGAEGLHQLDVHGLVTVGGKDAEMGLTSVNIKLINWQ